MSGAQQQVSEPDTRTAPALLTSLNQQLLAVPDGFSVNPKLQKQLERRREALTQGEIDWAHAEALAFASLLHEGISIRLTGQDTERGTFSQRHLVLYDIRTGQRYAPIQNLAGARAPFELYNSPLSEFACLGFEYGYAVAAPDALVLWEAQYCCCRTGTKARGLSTRARASSAFSPWVRMATFGSPTARRPRSTSTCCAARHGTRSCARSSSSRRRACCDCPRRRRGSRT